MAASLTRPTAIDELSAVNYLLLCIRQTPIVSLSSDNLNPSAIEARDLLAMRNITIQSGQVWNFNTDAGVVLKVDSAGKVPLPENIIRVTSAGKDAFLDVSQRGAFLYDRVKQTYIIGADVTVNMAVVLPFSELPQPARTYIAAAAAAEFTSAKQPGSPNLRALERIALESRVSLESFDATNAQNNLKHVNPFFARMRPR